MAARYPLVLNGTTIQELQSGDVLNGYVTPSSTDTLTNKTLTSPVINTPTGIVKGDVGLGNVDNTSDATKNSATATLTNKTLTSPVINTPTGIVKGDVGLGNVDNTSDATKNSASVTLTNKTLTNPTITSYIETIYALSGTDIDPANGTIQTKTLGSNTTFTESLTDGQSVVLMLNPVTYTVTWPTMTWISIAGTGTSPTLEASSTNVVTIWQVGGTVYGNWAGSA
jgi:hypothetical protein